MPLAPAFTKETAPAAARKANEVKKRNREAELAELADLRARVREVPVMDFSARALTWRDEADRLRKLMRETTGAKELQALSVAASNAEELFCRFAQVPRCPTAKQARSRSGPSKVDPV